MRNEIHDQIMRKTLTGNFIFTDVPLYCRAGRQGSPSNTAAMFFVDCHCYTRNVSKYSVHRGLP